MAFIVSNTPARIAAENTKQADKSQFTEQQGHMSIHFTVCLDSPKGSVKKDLYHCHIPTYQIVNRSTDHRCCGCLLRKRGGSEPPPYNKIICLCFCAKDMA